MKKGFAVMIACAMAGCVAELSADLEGGEEQQGQDEDLGRLEAMAIQREGASEGKTDTELVSPTAAPCGKSGPNLENRRVNDASSPNAANQRSGSSTSCAALGVLQPSDDAIYFCFTVSGSATWTYLQNVRTGVRGWVLDDLLRLNPNGVNRGSVVHCGF